MKTEITNAARGLIPADLVCNNLTLFNPFTLEWEETSFAVHQGIVVGIGDYRGINEKNFHGRRVVPGLIDSHVHIESSLLTPVEFGRLVLGHGTTTVIADPHEIANVAGLDGIDYMIREREHTPLDILITLPSCVPATPLDCGGAVLTAADLRPYLDMPGVPGLAEMMNVPGVLSGAPEVWEKLSLCKIIDGHAPLLTGKDLNAYICAGIGSDHECTTYTEVVEKLRRGMHIMIREGSTERNLEALISLVNHDTVSRCSFATDDRHVDMLAEEGQIDDCIRKAIALGLEPELALRMATLSATEHFCLPDRGAVAPGRLADFCVLAKGDTFRVETTYKHGIPVTDRGHVPRPCLHRPFSCAPLSHTSIALSGEGEAHVMGIQKGQILTEDLCYSLDQGEIPDTEQDILKVVVCDRYRSAGCGTGLVHGLGIKEGAIACSVSHDCHNIVACGMEDDDILRAISEIISSNGGMVTVRGKKVTLLPLECGGLMSALPCEEVTQHLRELKNETEAMGAVENPFMYLSFLALTVIPHLRITERGPFDVDHLCDCQLFR